MANFKIPNTSPTTCKTIRFPISLVEKIEKAIRGKECTFTAFVIAAAWAALEDKKTNEQFARTKKAPLCKGSCQPSVAALTEGLFKLCCRFVISTK